MAFFAFQVTLFAFQVTCFAFQVHEIFDITEKVPRVGGRELDLYMLYRNVTALGGCERVIQTKHWRDAAESFNFPETITSVSFSLRKAYFTFLWDYEQVRNRLLSDTVYTVLFTAPMPSDHTAVCIPGACCLLTIAECADGLIYSLGLLPACYSRCHCMLTCESIVCACSGRQLGRQLEHSGMLYLLVMMFLGNSQSHKSNLVIFNVLTWPGAQGQ